jgi:cell division protein FtsQ
MSISKKITRILFVCLWMLVGAGFVVLLVAAVNSRKNQVCNGYAILINGQSQGSWYIDKNDIVDVLTSNRTAGLKNKNIASFDLGKIETRLKNEVWIRDADLYFDNNGLLKVKVEEREPIARIFSSDGESFYLDSTGHKLPLSNKISAKLPVFTGFPANLVKWRTPSDKRMAKQIKEVSLFLLNNPFWMAQVSQIDILPSRDFEIVPTIGNHIIEFGDGSDYERKFNRLFIFYKQVLAKTGMEKYKRIKVQYDNEVIGVKKEK